MLGTSIRRVLARVRGALQRATSTSLSLLEKSCFRRPGICHISPETYQKSRNQTHLGIVIYPEKLNQCKRSARNVLTLLGDR